MIPREITIIIEVPTTELAKTLNAETRAVSGRDRRGHMRTSIERSSLGLSVDFCSGKTPMKEGFEQAED